MVKAWLFEYHGGDWYNPGGALVESGYSKDYEGWYVLTLVKATQAGISFVKQSILMLP